MRHCRAHKSLLPLLLLCGMAQIVHAADAPWPNSIGVSISSLENPYFVALSHGARDKAKQINPKVKFSVASAGYSVDKQIAQIQTMIQQKVQLILVSASAEDGLVQVLTTARQQGIIVIGVDVRAKGAMQTVLTHNINAGYLVCDYLARSLNGKGRAAIQTGPQVSSVIDRVAGCKQAWAKYPGIELLSETENGEGSVWGGYVATQQLIKQRGPVDMIFAINDRQAIGTQQALEKAKHAHTKIGSVDGSQAVVNAIAQGSAIIATASQSPRTMGQRAITLALALHAGEKISSEFELMQPTLVTISNAKDFKAWDANQGN
ncbi:MULTISPECIES: substrate-binding domain-containing protein [Deefgea]|uniref:Substrate-binding domain-containing protein n=1 Tax=Deefgea chitinilytica TaxID=570276 RepID=A0ABS2CD30_9NEIS|nr:MULTISPECIES: substrate-binding domain-containing protein [Deefgea]MBM5572057.1 substrate-binding domain-containing protein [Deefgea chitinilytica]MBM9889292.1 substrate-binding domain-containing protein [Deefgea sp. CFH1-16]